jgi:Ribosomal protein L11 methylase
MTRFEMPVNANYDVYLQRMDLSAERSSKGLIPRLAIGRTLDIGCGSGVLLRNLENAKGIDLNPKAVEECRGQGLDVECVSLADLNERFDTVIFSSVLHEFSSYADYGRFTEGPILEALSQAYDKLNPGGRLIIRDGIEGSRDLKRIIARTPEVAASFTKYMYENPVYHESYNIYPYSRSGNVFCIEAQERVLKEYMFTHTWGKESYPREVNEKYGILTVDKWAEVVSKSGFTIKNLETYPEEYEKFLSKYFYLDGELCLTNDLHSIFERSVILIVATKK